MSVHCIFRIILKKIGVALALLKLVSDSRLCWCEQIFNYQKFSIYPIKRGIHKNESFKTINRISQNFIMEEYVSTVIIHLVINPLMLFFMKSSVA